MHSRMWCCAQAAGQAIDVGDKLGVGAKSLGKKETSAFSELSVLRLKNNSPPPIPLLCQVGVPKMLAEGIQNSGWDILGLSDAGWTQIVSSVSCFHAHDNRNSRE